MTERCRIDTSKLDPPWAESTADLFMGAEVEVLSHDHGEFGMSRVQLVGDAIVAKHLTWGTGDTFYVDPVCLVEVDA